MRTLLFGFLFFFISFSSLNAQDLVIKTNGDSVRCKIYERGSSYSKVGVVEGNKYVKKSISAKEIAGFKFNFEPSPLIDLLIYPNGDTLRVHILKENKKSLYVELFEYDLTTRKNKEKQIAKSELKDYRYYGNRNMIDVKTGVDTLIFNNGNVMSGTIYLDNALEVGIKTKNKEGNVRDVVVEKRLVKTVNYGTKQVPVYYDQSKEENDPHNRNSRETDVASIGLGIGLDYGGFGTNVQVFPVSGLGFVAGIGYNLSDVPGWNVGLKLRLSLSNTRLHRLYVMGLYGYNFVLVTEYADLGIEELYTNYDFTFGFGFEIQTNREKPNVLSLGVLFPIHKDIPDYYLEDLENYYGFGISIGYRFGIATKLRK